MSEDPLYDNTWKEWILIVRRQLGFVDLADLIYGRSEEFVSYRKRHLGPDAEAEYPILFGEREGKIAYANRKKDPLFLFRPCSGSWVTHLFRSMRLSAMHWK